MESWAGESVWLPEPGEWIVGTFDGVEQIEGRFGMQSVMRVIDTEGTTWRVRMTAVLKSLIEEKKPEVGQQLGVKYFGRHESKRYHKWGVVCGDRPDIDDPEIPEHTA